MGSLRGHAASLLKKRSWAILALLVLHLGNLFFFLNSHKPVATAAVPPTSNEPSLSCEQTVRLVDWGLKRSHRASKTSLSSSDFTRAAVRSFIERLDPQRLLYTNSEVNAFVASGKKAWREWAGAKKCEFFDKWVKTEHPKAVHRFHARLEGQLSKMAPLTPKANADEAAEANPPKYTDFAETEKVLEVRLNEWIARLREAASPNLLAAYGGDGRKYLRDSLEQLFFDTEPDSKGLIAKAALAAVDPYSTYFSPEEFEDFYLDLSGGTSGLGVRVHKVPAGLLIQKILPGSPAAKAKVLKTGHVLTKIDGNVVKDMSGSASKALLKGPEGSLVRLEVVPVKGGKPVKLTVKREHFNFEEAKITHRLIRSRVKGTAPVAVVQIPSFYGRGGMGNFERERSSSEDLRVVLSSLLKAKQKPSALVLDLRGNPGGYLEEAVTMAGYFLGDEPVVEVVEAGQKRILRGEDGPLYRGPIVVLIDEETASASEVLAGALKDHQRAVVVGSRRSYGKGSVQKLFHLDDDLLTFGLSPVLGKGVVKLTTSVFYSPLGHTPANGGVTAHIPLPMEDEDEDGTEESDKVAAPVAGIPEENPFLDETSLKDLQKRAEEMKTRLAKLEVRSQERLSGRESSRNALNAAQEIKRLESENPWPLSEAVSVATDFVAFDEQLTPHISVREESPGRPERE